MSRRAGKLIHRWPRAKQCLGSGLVELWRALTASGPEPFNSQRMHTIP